MCIGYGFVSLQFYEALNSGHAAIHGNLEEETQDVCCLNKTYRSYILFSRLHPLCFSDPIVGIVHDSEVKCEDRPRLWPAAARQQLCVATGAVHRGVIEVERVADALILQY